MPIVALPPVPLFGPYLNSTFPFSCSTTWNVSTLAVLRMLKLFHSIVSVRFGATPLASE